MIFLPSSLTYCVRLVKYQSSVYEIRSPAICIKIKAFDWITLSFFKQPAYKQVALGWQIAKQLLGLKRLSLSNNKKLKIKEKWSFSFVINVK